MLQTEALSGTGSAPGVWETFADMQVKDVIPPGAGALGCSLGPRDALQLGDLAEAMASSKCTAMAVNDSTSGKVVGLLTVNDIMRAFFEGASRQGLLHDWMATGWARAPSSLLGRLLVRPTASLASVAEKMVANANSGDCACHHVVVQDTDDRLYGVVSSHDLVHALCRSPSGADQKTPDMMSSVAVDSVMKPRDCVFTCPRSGTIADALKILLMTQQGSVVIISETGVDGFFTPRDAVVAFARGVARETCLANWLETQDISMDDRSISSNTSLADAAEIMNNLGIDHLAVMHNERKELVGVLSSLDVVLHTSAHAPILQAMYLPVGPTVGEVLSQHHRDHTHLASPLAQSLTLGAVAELLRSSGRTCAIVAPDDVENPEARLLTENDLVRAFVDGKRSDTVIEELFDTMQVQMPHPSQVSPSIPLTEAASLMVGVAEPGRECHYLVVRDVSGKYLGVFSALDVARAIHAVHSGLDIAKLGIEQTTIGMVMKQSSTLPTCSPTDSIVDAFNQLNTSGYNVVLVSEDENIIGLVSSTCVLQALQEDIPHDMQVSEFLTRRTVAQREILIGRPLVEAAAHMSANSLHHLLVMDRMTDGSTSVVGVLSAFDLVRSVVWSNYRPLKTLAEFHPQHRLAVLAPMIVHKLAEAAQRLLPSWLGGS
eukprot:TRINITY_DN5037_c0_g1_i1.p1 TRINITY_DN5037_c0_g1~~TRINITY_DN5037_c0_g1_i1.p1  ORF type:complete len:659 (+),score=80.47 TRINITY_DN5037_c0_g1_i1:73-2049(+)